jgi:hypothetical protein
MDMRHKPPTGRVYNSVFNVVINICEFLNGTDSNLLGRWFINTVSRTLPEGMLHPCPYTGEFKAPNISLDVSPEMAFFLVGQYRMRARMFDDEDDNIVTFLVDTELY